jgi:P-type Cu2+ transporter
VQSNGILVRNRLALEAAREIDIVIFDKTGTLTQGQFGVVDMVTADDWDNDRASALAAALESDSEHLIAQSIRRLARDRKLVIPPVSSFSALKGRGVQASFENETYYLGGPRLLEMLSLKPASNIADFTNSANSNAQSVVYLTAQKKIIAAIAIADVIRPESKQAVDELKHMGIEVAMLTGDSESVAKAVAYQLGIKRVFAEVLPEHKDQKVMELQKLGKRVAMVGDGVNDAPALTRADVGIAIGGGTDVAIESAGLILVNSNPLGCGQDLQTQPRQLSQDDSKLVVGGRLQHRRHSACGRRPRPLGHSALTCHRRGTNVCQHNRGCYQCTLKPLL